MRCSAIHFSSGDRYRVPKRFTLLPASGGRTDATTTTAPRGARSGKRAENVQDSPPPLASYGEARPHPSPPLPCYARVTWNRYKVSRVFFLALTTSSRYQASTARHRPRINLRTQHLSKVCLLNGPSEIEPPLKLFGEKESDASSDSNDGVLAFRGGGARIS